MHRIALAGVAVAALMIPQPASADTATDWWELASRFNFAQQVAAMPSPPETQRASARAAVGVF